MVGPCRTVIDCWAVPGAKSSVRAWSAFTTQEPGWLKVTTPAAIVQTPAEAAAIEITTKLPEPPVEDAAGV